MSDRGVEVFRILPFDTSKEYEYAMYTSREGRWPNERFFTTNPLKFLGKYTHSERFGYCGDGSRGVEHFVHNGEKTSVEYDYEGRTCFREVPKSSSDDTATV